MFPDIVEQQAGYFSANKTKHTNNEHQFNLRKYKTKFIYVTNT